MIANSLNIKETKTYSVFVLSCIIWHYQVELDSGISYGTFLTL